MAPGRGSGPPLRFEPATAARWPDVERLFGERGACGGCWCMWWRLPRAEFERGKGEPNRRALRRLVRGGAVPGLLAYAEGEPVGWCALGPREDFPRLDRSRVLRRLDETPVWCAPCLFLRKDWRRRGASARLLAAAVDHARRAGAPAVEGYPVVPRGATWAPAFAWTGFLSAFERAGFREVARRSPGRPVVRRRLRPRRPTGADARAR